MYDRQQYKIKKEKEKGEERGFMVGEDTWDHFPCASQILCTHTPHTLMRERDKKMRKRNKKKERRRRRDKKT